MMGRRKGVAKQILTEEPRALHTHCYGYALNLACQDMIRDVKRVKDALDVTFQLSKLLKYSAKQTAEYQRLKQELAPEQSGFRTLCPTRWTVRAASLSSILTNYQVLQECLESFTELAKMDREMSAKCNGVRSQFATFDFLFGVALGKHQGGGLIPAVPVYAKHIHVRGGGSCRAHSCVTGNQCDK